MKTLLLLLITSLCYGQAIPKGAERIELITSVADSALLATVKQFIANEQFTIGNQAPSRFSFSTDYKPVGNISIRLFVTVLNHKVLVHGLGQALAMGLKNEPLVFDGTDSSLPKAGFTAMNKLVVKLAVQIAGSTLDYPVNLLNPAKGD